MSRRDELAANLASVQSRITNPNVTLIVVTKTYPVSDVQILSELGITHFGENRNEEGLEKSSAIEDNLALSGRDSKPEVARYCAVGKCHSFTGYIKPYC